MKTLYVSQSACYVSLRQEFLLVRQKDEILAEVQLPLLEQVLLFGQAQVTTQAIRACLTRNIPIVYLSRMGFCYGRTIALERGYRSLQRYQQDISLGDRLQVARAIVLGKIRNCRVILQRQQRRRTTERLKLVINSLDYLTPQVSKATSLDQLLGYEGLAAQQYFSAFGDCLDHPDFLFQGRSRRPPGNPVNALLSFGYQVLWNHVLALIELQGLDPYQACLHEGHESHAALASDLIEEFRAPLIDSLVLYLINRNMLNVVNDFEYRDGGCFLGASGRKRFLQVFVQRMEATIQTSQGDNQPHWALLMTQVKRYKQFIYSPAYGYQPYLIR